MSQLYQNMLAGGTSSSRTQSMASTIVLADSSAYDSVDVQKLYQAVLKVVVLEYRNEARFRTPVPVPTTNGHSGTSSTNLSASSYSNSGSGPGSSTGSKSGSSFRSSRVFDTDTGLPLSLMPKLQKRLHSIATRQSDSQLDERMRRSLLAFYSQVLDPSFQKDVAQVNQPQYLAMKFVACATKELPRLGVSGSDVSRESFQQATQFLDLLISLVDRENVGLVNHLIELKEGFETSAALRPQRASPAPSSQNVKYPQPSFRLTDLDQGALALIKLIFAVDDIKLQQDVIMLKDLAQACTLHKDLQQIGFYLEKDVGFYGAHQFETTDAYEAWKARERSYCTYLTNRYKVLPGIETKLPALPTGEEYYVVPTRAQVRPYFVTIIRMFLQSHTPEHGEPILSSQFQKHLHVLSKVWRLDAPTFSVSILTAALISECLEDTVFEKRSKDPFPINVSVATEIFQLCRKYLAEPKTESLDDRHLWASPDQDEWVGDLVACYSLTLCGIKESLYMLFNKQTKPKFGPYLQLLGEYIESDLLFSRVAETPITKKWEKKLSRTLLKVAEIRYADLLSNLPRDSSLSLVHVLDIADSLVAEIRMLQKRYKNPLLGFLYVPHTVAQVQTAMFALDAKNIINHIQAYHHSRNEFIAYSDAIETYKSMREVRDIFLQVSPKSSIFKFDLEEFFFPYLKQMVEESGDKFSGIVDNALKSDVYQPITTELDSKKNSEAVLLVFSLFKKYLKILQDLDWPDLGQMAVVYTIFLRSVSNCAVRYSTAIGDKIMKELDEEEQRRTNLALAEKTDVVKRQGPSGWFDDMRNAVTNIQNAAYNKNLEVEPFNFKSETCTALNNLSAAMKQLEALEEVLDPEEISKAVASNDPRAKKRYTSHLFSIRLVRAENLRRESGTIHPYATLISSLKTIGKTRTLDSTCDPEWDEEFDINIAPNKTATVSVTVWDRKMGSHILCGRALIQLDPLRFKDDGIPQEVYLDLDTQGRLLVEIMVESERDDAIFVMGRAHRDIKRCQERCIKLIVEKFSRFIHSGFSRANLKTICGNNGHIKPTEEQMDNAMMPLYNYLNTNLQVLAAYLTKDLLLKVMLQSWNVIVRSADELMLPKLLSYKSFKASIQNLEIVTSGWLSVTSAVANVANSITKDKQLSNIEIDTVFAWLNFLCIHFFHNDGNGPPIKDLKTEQYQALLLVPVHYDRDVHFLEQELGRLAPAYIQVLRERNNIYSGPNPSQTSSSSSSSSSSSIPPQRQLSRATSIIRHKTVTANGTARARAKARKEVENARMDPVAADAFAEDIVLRLLILKGDKTFVARRLEERERLAHTMVTERLTRLAVQGKRRQ